MNNPVFEKYFSDEDVDLLLSAISDTMHVTPTLRGKKFIANNKPVIDQLTAKLLQYKRSCQIFYELGLYDDCICVSKEDIDILIDLINIALNNHPVCYIFNTYIGNTKEFAQELKNKLIICGKELEQSLLKLIPKDLYDAELIRNIKDKNMYSWPFGEYK